MDDPYRFGTSVTVKEKAIKIPLHNSSCSSASGQRVRPVMLA